METNDPPIIVPKFTEKETETLKQYFEFNKRYYQKINEELTGQLERHPLWGPILKMQSPEQRKLQSEQSLELQRAAIYEGKWKEYTDNLVTQGINYARMNVSYSDWHGIIKLYKEYLIPHIRKDFVGRTDDAISYLDGLTRFIDFAMYGIAEAYFKEKNNIIRAKEERFRAIFENSVDNISLIDRNGTIMMINHVTSGFKKEEMIGRSIFDFQTGDNAVIVREAIRRVFEMKTPATFEITTTNEDKPVYYSSSAGPIFDEKGEVTATVVISRDVSAQKIAEAEIRELNADLEQKVNQRTEALKTSNKELESFCYSVSHDLRTPLRAINGFTQILQEDYSASMNDDAKDVMHEIIANATKMGQLIDDLLEFSRLGKQGVVKGSTDMNELVGGVITELTQGINGRKIEFNVKFMEKAKGDRGMLKQVMTNLIGNAIKYSGKKEAPVIEIGCYKDKNDLVYYVKDNGAGFDMAYYSKLFSVFQRLHSANEFEGTGVGLAIVQRIITKHNGRLWAEGKEGEGATFYIALPN